MIEEELRRAASDLRTELQHVTPPPFKPRPQVGARVLLVAAVVAVFAIGVALVTSVDDGPDTDPAEAPEPDVIDSELVPDPDGDKVETERPVPGPAVTDQVHRPATEMARPALDRFSLEPEFGTIIAAATAVSAGALATPLPAGAPSWNADGSLLVLYETGTITPSHVLYDGVTFERIGQLPFTPLDIEQLHWDPSDPNRLFFVEEATLQAYDIESLDPLTGTQSQLPKPEGCTTLSTARSHKPLSADGNLIGLACEDEDGKSWVALDINTGESFRVPANGEGAPVPTADRSRFIVVSDDGLASVLDAALQPTGISFQIETGGFVLIEIDDGRHILVTTIFSLGEDQIGSVIGYDIDTGLPLPAVGLATGFAYPPGGTVMSTSLAADGLVTVSIADRGNPESHDTLDGELLLVDFNTPEPTAYRLGHHRSANNGATFNEYRSTPWTALSPDGTRMLFASHWGEGQVDTFVIDITTLRN